MKRLECLNKILFNELLTRFDTNKEKHEKKLEVELNISIAFPKQKDSDFIEKDGRFNMKFSMNIKDADNQELVIKYLSEYSIKYLLNGENITEKEIMAKNLIDKNYILDALERMEATLKLAGFNFSIKEHLKSR